MLAVNSSNLLARTRRASSELLPGLAIDSLNLAWDRVNRPRGPYFP
jgi:hypothetical protein